MSSTEALKKRRSERIVNLSRYFFLNFMKLVEVNSKVCQFYDPLINSINEKAKQN